MVKIVIKIDDDDDRLILLRLLLREKDSHDLLRRRCRARERKKGVESEVK